MIGSQISCVEAKSSGIAASKSNLLLSGWSVEAKSSGAGAAQVVNRSLKLRHCTFEREFALLEVVGRSLKLRRRTYEGGRSEL